MRCLYGATRKRNVPDTNATLATCSAGSVDRTKETFFSGEDSSPHANGTRANNFLSGKARRLECLTDGIPRRKSHRWHGQTEEGCNESEISEGQLV